MNRRSFVHLFILVFAFFVYSFAQTAKTESIEEKEKRRKSLENLALQMVDQSVGETAALKLPHNRAFPGVFLTKPRKMKIKVQSDKSANLF